MQAKIKTTEDLQQQAYKEKKRRAQEIQRQKQYNANINSARKFLRFGEQRFSTDSSFIGSEISNIAMEHEIDYTNIFDRKQGHENTIRETQDHKGLNEQAIRIGFLDRKPSARPTRDGITGTANPAIQDFESQMPRPSKLDFFDSEDGELIPPDNLDRKNKMMSD